MKERGSTCFRMKRVIHIPRSIRSHVDVAGTGAITASGSQQQGCPDRPAGAGHPAVVSWQDPSPDRRHCGAELLGCSQDDQPLQCRRFRIIGRQASKKSSAEKDGTIRRFAKRSCTDQPSRLGLSVQRVDSGAVARIPGPPQDIHCSQSTSLVPPDGRERHCLPATEVWHGTP